MVKGLRHAALAVLPRLNQQAVISNNLANLNSSGFKKDRLFVEILRHQGESNALDDQGLALSERMVTDFSQGALEGTGAPLDLALSGSGFFAVQTADGEALTRGGSFHLAPDGKLVTARGEPLLGAGGPISIPRGASSLSIGADGTISTGGRPIDRLRLLDVADPTRLQKIEAGLFLPADTATLDARDTQVRQGFLESSNANAIEEMTKMMTLFREYEAAQRAMKIQGDTVKTAITRVGRAQ